MSDAMQAEMPKYRSHKHVWALKIAAVEIHADGSATVAPDDARYAPFKVDRDYVTKRFPTGGWETLEKDLGYFVVYADGYKSWSPTAAFEDGYTRV